jgi:tRNA (adenine57-N1/adenine58-N1)-methyltransferase
MKIQHGTQIVYPKDLGYIAARVGLESGQKVVEIGTGSGSMTIFLASILKPRGHVYTFDVSNEFMKIAQKNIEKAKNLSKMNLQILNVQNIFYEQLKQEKEKLDTLFKE